MSLFHSTPVTVQRTYYKPSAMSRLRALFSSRRRTAVPVATRTTHQRRRRPVRQPVRKTGGFGLFRRTPRARRTVVTPQRRRGGLFASLRPRRHYGRTRVAPAPRQHHHHGKGRTFATVLAALSLRKHRHRHGAYGGAPMRPRY
ncbi:hypothetical protein K457DRAFT_141117 [Linnemannia elongata AG-77]|uniref:Uncharacterized protein n=1 Tax=Linnemannia elongata AG-77 TaxID=1314771 RepID=A0A197JLU6_9FUNG|nr:hypothetical protein K457DRAFT_141117 [Linnemannia elongata AG-77]